MCLKVFDTDIRRKKHIEDEHTRTLKGELLKNIQLVCMNLDGPGVRNVPQEKIDFHFPASARPPNFDECMRNFLADIHSRISDDTLPPLRTLTTYKAELTKVTRYVIFFRCKCLIELSATK